jgi:hypothetical protein
MGVTMGATRNGVSSFEAVCRGKKAAWGRIGPPRGRNHNPRVGGSSPSSAIPYRS